MSFLRLDKIITDSGVCSRSQAKEWIRQGRVAVNGAVCTDPASKWDPAATGFSVNGEPIGESGHIYVMLHKPAGVLTAARDPRQPTVMDLMPPAWKKRGLFPVGRLDKDTTGLLLLTDDGEWGHRIISPKSRVSKLYEARVDGTAAPEDAEAFRRGIVLKDGLQCLPAELEILSPGLVRVTVFEGKYHQVKRMLASRGLPVTALKRLRVGGLGLDESLSPGEYRLLTKEETDAVAPGMLSK